MHLNFTFRKLKNCKSRVWKNLNSQRPKLRRSTNAKLVSHVNFQLRQLPAPLKAPQILKLLTPFYIYFTSFSLDIQFLEMSSVAVMASLLLLLPILLHSKTATSDLLSPLFSPIFDDVCKEVECGRGDCKSSPNRTFFFECQCDPGWKQMGADHDPFLNFLPCIVPNCTLNSACTEAAPPVQQESKKTNDSIFDPCRWADCGGGSCKKLSEFTYACECANGYNNLLNVSAFPCYRQCAFGMDCANLGIPLSNTSSSGTPALPDSGKNQAPGENICWWVFLTMALALWV